VEGVRILFATASRPTLGPTQPPIKWVPRALSPGVKGPGREADIELYFHSPIRLNSVGAELYRDNFIGLFSERVLGRCGTSNKL
jgi:hypothetical protein